VELVLLEEDLAAASAVAIDAEETAEDVDVVIVVTVETVEAADAVEPVAETRMRVESGSP